jgi:hypothetical protein
MAEALWRVTRCYHPEGEDAELDAFLASLRESLDEVGAMLEQEDPDGYDSEDAVNDRRRGTRRKRETGLPA